MRGVVKLLKSQRILAFLAASLVVVAAIGVGWLIISRPVIPPDIKKQIDFLVLYPQGDSNIVVDRSTFKYDSQNHVLSFVVTCFGVKNTITEQATPDSFNDIPQYLDKVLQQLNSYSSFDTDMGKANLTHPSNLNGDQAAVMNTKGVLMFAHPVSTLTESQWRQFFNSLSVIK